MAGFDYVHCNECGKRLFYDGEWEARNYMINYETTKSVTCDKCVSRLKKKIDSLKKHDRRRH